MALYNIVLNKKIRKKDLASIPASDVRRIVQRIEKLAQDPFPADAVRLKGRDEWRIRQGDYRILYTVDETIITVHIVKVGHRRKIYRS